MQVKVCPKCGAENRDASAACSNCYTSLEGVALTESAKAAQPVAAAPAVPRPPITTPSPASTQQPPAPTQQMSGPPRQMPGGHQQTQMGAPGPPPGMPQRLPDGAYTTAPKRSAAPIIAFVVVIVLAALGGVGYLAVGQLGAGKTEPIPTEQPDKVVLALLEAKKTHEIAKVQPYFTQRSLDRIKSTLSGAQAESAGFDRAEVAKMLFWDVSPTVDDLRRAISVKASVVKDDPLIEENKGRVAVVHIERQYPAPALFGSGSSGDGDSSQAGRMAPVTDEYVFVLCAEGGKWKLDLDMTAKHPDNQLLIRLPGLPGGG